MKRVVKVPSSVRNAPMRRAIAGARRKAAAQRKNGATPSQTRGRRRPAPAGRTASMLSAVAASWIAYRATSSQPSAMTVVAASFCSGVGNCTFSYSSADGSASRSSGGITPRSDMSWNLAGCEKPSSQRS
jgi:hypothetical protein